MNQAEHHKSKPPSSQLRCSKTTLPNAHNRTNQHGDQGQPCPTKRTNTKGQKQAGKAHQHETRRTPLPTPSFHGVIPWPLAWDLGFGSSVFRTSPGCSATVIPTVRGTGLTAAEFGFAQPQTAGCYEPRSH